MGVRLELPTPTSSVSFFEGSSVCGALWEEVDGRLSASDLEEDLREEILCLLLEPVWRERWLGQ